MRISILIMCLVLGTPSFCQNDIDLLQGKWELVSDDETKFRVEVNESEWKYIYLRKKLVEGFWIWEESQTIPCPLEKTDSSTYKISIPSDSGKITTAYIKIKSYDESSETIIYSAGKKPNFKKGKDTTMKRFHE